MTTQLQKQRKKSFDHIFKWAEEQFRDLAELFIKKKSDIILETARRLEKEGCEESKISNEIVTNLSGFVDDSYVHKVLKDYPQYKDQKHVKSATSRRNIPATEREPINLDDKDVTVEPVSGTQEEPITTETTRKIAENILTLSPTNTQPNNKTIEQPGPGEVYLPGMPEKFGVEYFEFEKLNTYPLEYCRKVIRWLNEVHEEYGKDCFKWDKEIRDHALEINTLQKENAALKKENDQFKKLPNNDALYNRIDVLQKEIAELRRQQGQSPQKQEKGN
jgi:hypothetical protein